MVESDETMGCEYSDLAYSHEANNSLKSMNDADDTMDEALNVDMEAAETSA